MIFVLGNSLLSIQNHNINRLAVSRRRPSLSSRNFALAANPRFSATPELLPTFSSNNSLYPVFTSYSYSRIEGQGLKMDAAVRSGDYPTINAWPILMANS